MPRFRRIVVLAAASLTLLAAPAGAVPRVYKQQGVEPPTTSAITAVGEGVFVTAAGEAFADRDFRFRPAAGIAGGVAFTDVARSGPNVVAVGKGGAIWRSTDGGASFAQVTGTTTYTNTCIQGGANPSGPVQVDLFSVKFADPSTVYVTGENATILKSTTAGQVFSEVNKRADGTCVITSGAFAYDAISDTAWVNASTGFLISRNFGRYFATTDGLGSAAPRGNATNVADTGGASGQPVRDRPQIALDPDDPSRAWAVNIGSGLSHFMRTADGGATWTNVTADGANAGLNDIGMTARTRGEPALGLPPGGGEVIAVGDGGEVYRSLDGISFAREDDTERRTTAFRGIHGALIGGDGGALVRGEDAASPIRPAMTFTPEQPCTGSGITFDARASTSSAGPITAYAWDLDGNGSFETDTGALGTASSVYDFNRYDPPLPGFALGRGGRLTGRVGPVLVLPSFGAVKPIPELVRDPVVVTVRLTDGAGNQTTYVRTVRFLDEREGTAYEGKGLKCPLRKTGKLKPGVLVSSRKVKLRSGAVSLRVDCKRTGVCLDRITLRTRSGRSLFRTAQVGFPPGPPVRLKLGLTRAGAALVKREGTVKARLALQDVRTRGTGPTRTVTLTIRR